MRTSRLHSLSFWQSLPSFLLSAFSAADFQWTHCRSSHNCDVSPWLLGFGKGAHAMPGMLACIVLLSMLPY